jgi:predicted transposase YdaD
LVKFLGRILRIVVQALPANQAEEWVTAIGVYVMSVNKNMNEAEYKETLKSVFPTQFEPGSLADRLLTQGREEGMEKGREEGREEGREQGKLAGKIQLIQELLGAEVATDENLLALDEISLSNLLAELQQRLRAR